MSVYMVEPEDGRAIALENGILVDARCHTNVPAVFAAGDVANLLHPVFGWVRVEHYRNGPERPRS
jgi:3-phenylpropionate/trans-cinnamate dioxygenase ferredoxin reductase subunit